MVTPRFGKKAMLITAMLLVFGICDAKKLPGYMINAAGDTIIGEVKVSKTNQVTSALILNGHDIDSFYDKLTFKGKGEKRFKVYLPGSVTGFGFDYRGTGHYFGSFLLEFESIVEEETKSDHFLHRLYRGDISLYLYKRRTLLPPNNMGEMGCLSHIEFVFQSQAMGAVRIGSGGKQSNVKSLLLAFGVPDAILQQMPANISSDQIKEVLEAYDGWRAK